MQLRKPVLNIDKIEITRQSSKRTIMSRSTTPLTSNKDLLSEKKLQKFPVRVEYKKPSTPVPLTDRPYVMMRNGVTFLYTPGTTERSSPSLISPFGTPLRGFKIRGRPDKGNMFALHSEERIASGLPLQPRSYLNMRSKWK